MPIAQQTQRGSRNYHERDLTLYGVVKELFFTAIKQGVGRLEKQ